MRTHRNAGVRRRWQMQGSIAVSLVVLAACGGSGDDGSGTGPGGGGAGGSGGGDADGSAEITISMVEDADTLDPTFGQTFGGRYVFMHMCEKLYDLSPELEIVPQLAAELPTVSADGLTVSIPLREGVQFND